MTIREFYTNIESIMYALQRNESISAEEIVSVREKARELLEKHDASNEKRKGTETKEKKETAERRAAVLAFLKEQTEPVTRDTIAGVLDMEPAKVSGACKGLVDAGLVTKSEVKVEKARKIAYSAVR